MTPDPTPHSLIHGAAGFCTDHAQAAGGRTETVARVLQEHEWFPVSFACQCGWKPSQGPWLSAAAMIHDDRNQLAAHQAAAVVAALGDETARLREAMETLIRDLDTGRADGTIYTYGQIQRRLRAALDPEEPR